ncbi:alpha/beta-hydrolase [Saitoella complicata NRRL Y-17804]|nr:alpha/beta-hydrolase [Saitoella complicata NRRL Y-17804]ODQ54800.1 alpha/beta-hydrolase [Saitoella complicata NRRL Y-17804]
MSESPIIETISSVPGGHPFQSLDILRPASFDSSTVSRWVIFIHGGAWRDPNNTSKDGHPLLTSLLSTTTTTTSPPFGCASLNYRLSPDVTHPAHLDDCISALRLLHEQYGMQEYILVGHSAGATLAFQIAHALSPSQKGDLGTLKSLICTEGLYDLADLCTEYPDYTSFVESAFDSVRAASVASPVNLLEGVEKEGVEVVLVQSMEDELLSPWQTGLMEERLERRGWSVEVRGAAGKHDEVFVGPEVVEVAREVIEKVWS